MNSKISIDFDPSKGNQPIIKIEYSPSEDVRDKLVKSFLDGFGEDSVFALFHYPGISSVSENGKVIAVIEPIKIQCLPAHLEVLGGKYKISRIAEV